MPEDNSRPEPSEPNPSVDAQSLPAATTVPTEEGRSQLLEKARAFLASPQVRHDDPEVSRKFLSEKGLNDEEINSLMKELPRQTPIIPPRTYPQPPPSNLPLLLFGLARIITWAAGASATLVLIYYRFLLPRITQTALARRALKAHQITLLTRMHSSLISLKSTQAETFAVLPKPKPRPLEESKYLNAHSLDDLSELDALEVDKPLNVPEFTLLRCAIEGCGEKKPTTQQLFELLEAKFEWLKTEKGRLYEESLWNTLASSPHFEEVSQLSGETQETLVWTYTPPTPPSPVPPTALLSSLTSLHAALPIPASLPAGVTSVSSTSKQGAIQALRELTAFVTTRTYNLLGTGPMRFLGVGSRVNGTTEETPEEEIKKEIRALKSLVLNRRTFAPTRTATTPPTILA